MKELIQKYTEAYGPSGFEDKIREMVQADVEGLADDIAVDGLGNLTAIVKPKSEGGGKKVMLVAHMDEIGVIVTHIDKQGFCRFTNIGGVFPLHCIGSRVRFGNGTIGIIGREHDASGSPSLREMFIDVGATGRDDCPVAIGDAAGFWRPFEALNDTRVSAKSMDDRISVAILIETMRRLENTPHEVAFTFSVQEEVGLRGAGPAAFSFDPDIALSVDVTLTGDIPKHGRMAVSLGGGPAIKVRDSGMLADPRIVRLLRKRAQAAELPYQMEILEGGTTDARAIQVTRSGVPVGCISVPCRHIHSPSEVVDLNDVENVVKLLLAFLAEPIEL